MNIFKKSNHINLVSRIICLLVLFAILSYFPVFTLAQSPSDLQNKINARNEDIKALEREIAGYQSQLTELSKQANSLASTIKSLELTEKKLEADIKVTENKISAKNLELNELGIQIEDKEETISDDRRIISHSLSLINRDSGKSIVEMLLASQSLSDSWNSLEELDSVQANLLERIGELRQVKASLEENKKATEKAKLALVALNKQLNDQKKVTSDTSAEKNALLKQTKQSESQYQKILAEKSALKDAFEREVLEYESQLKLSVDSSKLPHSGSGVLLWPLDNVHITQYFGNTSFSTANPQIYNGKGHTGVDFRASIGTPIKASYSGVVSGVANTDSVPGCYSYGKWVMIKHPNGLSTLYAHLSLQSVSTGDSVKAGQVIGYSGNTGYTTGPHLHFGVYATDGVQIQKLTKSQSKHCAGATIPLADFKAYLNPLSYL